MKKFYLFLLTAMVSVLSVFALQLIPSGMGNTNSELETDSVELHVSFIANDSVEYALNTHSVVTIGEPISAIKVSGLDLTLDSVTFAIYDMSKSVLVNGLLSVNTIGYAEFAPVTLYEGNQYDVVVTAGDSIIFDQIVIGAAEEDGKEVAAIIYAGNDTIALNSHSAVSAEVIKALEVSFDGIIPTQGGYSINSMVLVEGEESSTWEVGETLAQGALSLNGKGYVELEEAVVLNAGTMYSVIINYNENGKNGSETFLVNGSFEEAVAPEVSLVVNDSTEYLLNTHSLVSVESASAIKVTGLDQIMESVSYSIHTIADGVVAEGTLSVNTIGYAEFEEPITFIQGSIYTVTIKAGEEELCTVQFHGATVEEGPEALEATIAVEGKELKVEFAVGTDLGDNYSVKPYIMNGENKVEIADYAIDNTTGGFFDPLNLIVITLNEELAQGDYTVVLPAGMFIVNGGDNNAEWTYELTIGDPEPEAPVIAIEEGEGTYTITSTSADAALYYLCKPYSWLDEGETPELVLQNEIEAMGSMVDSEATWDLYDHMGMQPAPKTFTVADYEEMYAGEDMFIVAANVGWDGEKLAVISNIEVKDFTVDAAAPELAVPTFSPVVPSDSVKYYLYNVETHTFMAGGNDWGTRASAFIDKALAVTVTENGETYKIGDLDCDGGASSWIDGVQGGNPRVGNGQWVITELEGNTFELTNTAAPAGTKWGVILDCSDTRTYFKNEPVYGYTWALVNEADYNAYMEVIDKDAIAALHASKAEEMAAWKQAQLDAANEIALAAQKALIDGTNVYEAEGYNAYVANYEAALAAFNEGGYTETVVNPSAATGWHSSTAYNFLLTPWTVGGEQANNFDKALYINTWSTEGVGDGSNFLVPFFEYWTGDGESLKATELATVKSGLTPGETYMASVWARVRIKNGSEEAAYGITFTAGGEPVDVCAGEQVGTSQFRIIKATATGVADEEGNLNIAFNVAEDNNISWLSYKDVYVAAPELVISDMKFTVAEDAALDEDGDFKVTLTYSIDKASEAFEMMGHAEAMVYVYDEEGTELSWAPWDLKTDGDPRNIFISKLEEGKTYTVKVERIEAGVFSLETFTDEAVNVLINGGLPSLTFTVPAIIPVIAEGDYAIKNVESGKFLNGSNSWGTKASVTTHAQFMTIALNDGKYSINSHYANGAKCYIGAGDNTFVDADAAYHEIEEVEGGFTIKDANGMYLVSDGIVANFNGTEPQVWQFLSKEEYIAEAVAAKEMGDLTGLVPDANFSRNNSDFNLWEGESKMTKGGPNNAMDATATGTNAERWGGNSTSIDFHTTVADLPNGKYLVKFQGYYRYNNTTDNTNDVAAAAHADGTEKIIVAFSANETSVPFMSIADEASVELYGKLPFSQAEASEAFTMGAYQNELEVEVTDGTLTLAITKNEADHEGCDWTVLDNIELYYLGAEDAPVLADCDLTQAMFFKYNSNTTGEALETPTSIGCDYNVGVSNSMIYGLSTVKWYAYADVTGYDKLVLTVTEGTPRVMYNREMDPAKTPEDDGVNHVEITTESPYLTVVECTDGSKNYIYDLKAMAAANPAKPYVHINAIKGFNFANAIITSMKLFGTAESAEDYLTGISTIATSSKANGKYIENGKIVIVKNGVKYNVAGSIIK